MLHIGCHLSASKGYYHMAKTAVELGADTFQFFTRNPRGGKAKAIDEKDIEKFLAFYSLALFFLCHFQVNSLFWYEPGCRPTHNFR